MVGPRFRTCWTSEGTESKCCFPSIPVVASIGESRLDETWAGPCGKSVYVELEEVSGLMAEVFQNSQLEVPHLLAQRRCLLRFCWIKEISQFWDPSWTQDSERNFFLQEFGLWRQYFGLSTPQLSPLTSSSLTWPWVCSHTGAQYIKPQGLHLDCSKQLWSFHSSS